MVFSKPEWAVRFAIDFDKTLGATGRADRNTVECMAEAAEMIYQFVMEWAAAPAGEKPASPAWLVYIHHTDRDIPGQGGAP